MNLVVAKRAGERRGEKETERGGAGREREGEIRWPLPVQAQGSLPEWAEQVLKLFLIYAPPPIPPPNRSANTPIPVSLTPFSFPPAPESWRWLLEMNSNTSTTGNSTGTWPCCWPMTSPLANSPSLTKIQQTPHTKTPKWRADEVDSY